MSQGELANNDYAKFWGGKRGVLWDCANFKAKTAASDGVLQTRISMSGTQNRRADMAGRERNVDLKTI